MADEQKNRQTTQSGTPRTAPRAVRRVSDLSGRNAETPSAVQQKKTVPSSKNTADMKSSAPRAAIRQGRGSDDAAPAQTEQKSAVRVKGGIDRIFLALVIILLCLGSIMVFSASYPYAETKFGDSMYFIRRQLIFAAAGVVAMLLISRIPYQFFRLITPAVYGVGLVLLVATLLMGYSEGVAKRWLGIPNTSFSFQPSEIMKVALVMMLAWYLERKRDEVVSRGKKNRKKTLLYGVIFPALIIGPAVVLVLLEKHLSGTAILLVIGLAVLFAGGAHPGWMALIFGTTGLAAGGAFIAMNQYAFDRVMGFIKGQSSTEMTDDRWQTLHGLWAIGSGGLLGLGLGQSRLKYRWVSQAHNDFIFTIWCEEMGFVGALALIILFGVLVWRGYVIAMRAPDAFSSLTVFGLTTHVAVQVILNIAVVTDIIPNTGITLPFFSYGGTSLLILMAEMGIILSISRHSVQKQ
ncbi:MAG: putative lipid II flippase FtsW [Clostridia bacterium]|nr:putative lipid II flippase FtsW [Clostridia bacterium]